ncbi:nitrilase-related carbon-nitrogen hydrolase [Anderseniella sp. Alg231-50]|uniref:nitrilase-related carbon-nitrogen hydrolase n=1 Tax=Anderseniella sp. Alg231-50 TaxID=1922226 RepID=UPI000D54B9CE
MLKAGIFQSNGANLRPADRLGALDAAITDQRLDLVVCPELFMSGYNVGTDLHRLAEPADGEFARSVADLARQTNTAICYGYPERDGELIFNSALVVSKSGDTISNHRKLAIPPGFEQSFFGPGDQLTSFRLGGMNCALVICYDVEFPEVVRAACMAGAEIVIIPTALGAQWDQVAHRVVPARAFENGCYALYANHAGSEGDITYAGASCVVGPDGRDIARAGDRPQLITASLEACRVAAARQRLPYFADLVALRTKLA